MKLRFNRNLQIGYGFTILILLAVGVFSYITLNNLMASNDAVERSNQVIRKLENTISIMKDAETGQRGFLLTNQAGFLEPYRGSFQKATILIGQVKKMTVSNPEQQQNIATIKEILIKRLNILQGLIDKRRNGGLVTTADLNNGKSAMDALRFAVDKAENEEQHILDQRIGLVNWFSFFLPVVMLSAILLALVISTLSYFRIVQDVNEKDRLSQELQIKEEETAAFNEELTAANEELNATNDELALANSELHHTQEKLAELNNSLEEKIKIRTKELVENELTTQTLNEELSAINEELAAANEEMLTGNEELAQSQEGLKKSEKLFRSIAVNIPKSLIIVIDREHRFLAIEGELMMKMGYNSCDYTGKHIAEVSPLERYEVTKHLYERVLAGEHFSEERKGANGGDFRVDFVPLIDDHGKVYAGLIIALDISEIKVAEEKSAKLAAIVESSDDAIISKTLEGIITSWNQAAERMFGYTESEMIGKSILKLIPDDRQEEEPMIISRLKKGERVEHFETKRVTSHQKELDVSLTISPIRDSKGNIIGVSKIARDISERKQDELRKNDFIGMVSHELKTPLTSLTALVQVLQKKFQNSEDRFVPGALDNVNRQVKKMTTMINGFLNVSRLESGKILIDKHPFDITILIQEALDEAILTITDHQLVFEPCDSLMVLADRDKIGSVVSNLISNAIKYSPNGKNVLIKCEVKGSNIQVSVSDEGIGIKAEHLGNLFERYYRVAANQTRNISGFGIGLYLSAEIIQRHDGKIWAESKSGVGSTFYFALPII